MAPLVSGSGPTILARANPQNHTWDGSWRDNASTNAFVLESWGQGFMVGSLLIMAGITVSNMRKGVLLHKLILLELFLAMSHGTFCFMTFDGYGWYLSATAALMYSSWQVHNVVAWIKIKPFLSPMASNFFIGTVALATPLILLQIVDNFRFFNNIDRLYLRIRPYEPLFRDPWWIFTCCYLLYMVRERYSFRLASLLHRSPRFGIMLLSMLLSIAFLCLDVCASVIKNFIGKDVVGINPFWKLCLVFKCFSDTVILDDFKTALERLRKYVFNDSITVDSGTTTANANAFGEDSSGATGGDLEARKARVKRRGGSIFDRSDYRNGSDDSRTGATYTKSRHTATARDAIGKVGLKISRLPGLGGADKKLADAKISSSSSTSSDEKPKSRHFEKEKTKATQHPEDVIPETTQQMSFEDFLKSDQAQGLSVER